MNVQNKSGGTFTGYKPVQENVNQIYDEPKIIKSKPTCCSFMNSRDDPQTISSLQMPPSITESDENRSLPLAHRSRLVPAARNSAF